MHECKKGDIIIILIERYEYEYKNGLHWRIKFPLIFSFEKRKTNVASSACISRFLVQRIHLKLLYGCLFSLGVNKYYISTLLTADADVIPAGFHAHTSTPRFYMKYFLWTKKKHWQATTTNQQYKMPKMQNITWNELVCGRKNHNRVLYRCHHRLDWRRTRKWWIIIMWYYYWGQTKAKSWATDKNKITARLFAMNKHTRMYHHERSLYIGLVLLIMESVSITCIDSYFLTRFYIIEQMIVEKLLMRYRISFYILIHAIYTTIWVTVCIKSQSLASYWVWKMIDNLYISYILMYIIE